MSDQELATLPGVTVPVVVVKRGNAYVRKRSDGFGTMTDQEVLEYKVGRPYRYSVELLSEAIWQLEQRVVALEPTAPEVK